MKVSVPYLVTRTGRDGRVRFYWSPAARLVRQGWAVRRLADDPLAARAEAEALNTALNAWRSGDQPQAAARDTLEAAVRAWQTSRLWHELRPATQRFYRQNLVVLTTAWGDLPLRGINRRALETLYVKLRANTPAKAKAVLRTCQALLRYAVHAELITEENNPCRKMRLTGTAAKGRVWSDTAVAKVVAAADAIGQHGIGTAVELNAWCGQRQADVLSWRRPEVTGDGRIRVTQAKTGAAVSLPVGIVPHLVERLAAEHGRAQARPVQSPYLVVDARGRPFKADHFRHTFAAVRTAAANTARAAGDEALAAEIEGVDFMHLRHTAVARLAEAGCELAEIAAITGHTLTSCTQIIDRYLVRTERLAERAFQRRMDVGRPR